MYSLLRPLLFCLDPERAHSLTLSLLRLIGAIPPLSALLRAVYSAQAHPVRVFGLDFPNRVGLAAGYDKDGLAWRGLACLGFGHIEIGTVTPKPQEGNPKPRLFRLPGDQALINRMGFPGRGAEFVLRQLHSRRPRGLVLGVNLGKNRDTPLESAAEDYLAGMRAFTSLADYLAINVSSPNTLGLRRLQARHSLDELLLALTVERASLERSSGKRIPLLVKIAPDLTREELDDAVGVLLDRGIDGIIAANTTLERDGLRSPHAVEAGGLSGAPLRSRAEWMVRHIYNHTQGRLPIIGVGGILTAQDAADRLEAGASLVQVYTGLIYTGPGLVRQIKES